MIICKTENHVGLFLTDSTDLHRFFSCFISEPSGSNDFQKDVQLISAHRAKKKIRSIRVILGVASVSLRRRVGVQEQEV